MTCIPPPLMRIPDLRMFTGAFKRGGTLYIGITGVLDGQMEVLMEGQSNGKLLRCYMSQ